MFAAFVLATVTMVAGWAQDSSSVPNTPSPQPLDLEEISKLQSHFPKPFAPYEPRRLPPPSLENSPLIQQFMHNGKLYLSINDAIALALENNLDLAIARFNLNIADTDIWRAESGSTVGGVDSGVVQNTPGGGVGGLGGEVGSGQGGTSVGAGGAGAGTGGIVGSTLGSGPPVTSFDPVVTGAFQIDRLTSTCNTPFCATQQNTASANFTYTQGFHWGTDLLVGFNNNRIASNSVYNFLAPALNSSFQLKLTQHLLQGFGLASNSRFIKIAKINREITDAAFRLQIITTVDQIENMYWALVYAYEDVKVQQEEMELAQKTLSNDKQQVEIGSLAPIEIVRAQGAIATNQQTLTVALTNLELTQLLMKNAISRNMDDPVLAEAEVIPTSTIELPAQEPVVPTQELVSEALSLRPELDEAQLTLRNTEISNKAVRSALLPTLDLSAYYGGAGLGGDQNPDSICLAEPVSCGLKTPPHGAAPISYGETLNQLINSTAPDKGASLSLNIPLRNRAAQSIQARSEFESQQAQLHIRQLQNQVRIEVRNAQFGVQQNRASVDAAQAAVELARQSLAYEQKKFDLRASTLVLVMQNQTALIQADATLVSAKVAYEKAVVELDRSTGHLLDHAGILIADSVRGRVTQTPNVPRVTSRPTGQPAPENPSSKSQP
jgi:outer membrane protein TolC